MHDQRTKGVRNNRKGGWVDAQIRTDRQQHCSRAGWLVKCENNSSYAASMPACVVTEPQWANKPVIHNADMHGYRRLRRDVRSEERSK
jgi:hypothetical protein